MNQNDSLEDTAKLETHHQAEIGPREKLQLRLLELRTQIAIVRIRLLTIKYRARNVAWSGIRLVDASAHDQLGAYPWLKLSAASLAAFITGRVLRRLPLSLMMIAARPLLATAVGSASRHIR
ncbi:hypothetical protein FBZ99_105451 [Rhizobium sp. ERR 1071]|uniref:hypothetical protein n=1 Tax=Rhizobium sp. ERR 1071 TaxID=2572677 RepID=UPI001199A0E8|nr:hypothetical protein [Rhizobium sp. ERR1071]TWB13580.1 hypothetical protein FBZ99_105451 [Rhizobium sp. ERR1071]